VTGPHTLELDGKPVPPVEFRRMLAEQRYQDRGAGGRWLGFPLRLKHKLHAYIRAYVEPDKEARLQRRRTRMARKLRRGWA
jgi:hypothetical protein